MLKIIMFMATMLSTCLPVHAEIYKWKDESGNIHYGDKPASNSKEMNIKQEAKPDKNISKAEREDRRRKLIETFDAERKEKKERQAKQHKQKVRRDKQCGQAKDRLRRYKAASSLYDVDKDGNRITLSKEKHRKSISRLQKNINKYCH